MEEHLPTATKQRCPACRNTPIRSQCSICLGAGYVYFQETGNEHILEIHPANDDGTMNENEFSLVTVLDRTEPQSSSGETLSPPLHTTLQEAYEFYNKYCVSRTAGETQRRETMLAWFSGATYVLACLIHNVDNEIEPTEKDTEWLQRTLIEAHAFSDAVASGEI